MGRPIAERLDEVVTLAETFCEEGAFPSADAAESMANALQTLADRKLLARIELPLLNRILSLLTDFVRSCESVNLFQVSIHFLPPSQQPDSVGVDAVLLGQWWNLMGERRWTKQAVTLGYLVGPGAGRQVDASAAKEAAGRLNAGIACSVAALMVMSAPGLPLSILRDNVLEPVISTLRALLSQNVFPALDITYASGGGNAQLRNDTDNKYVVRARTAWRPSWWTMVVTRSVGASGRPCDAH